MFVYIFKRINMEKKKKKKKILIFCFYISAQNIDYGTH